MKFFEVAKFEYRKIVRKPSFWVSTLFLPIFIGIVGFVSGYSSIDATTTHGAESIFFMERIIGKTSTFYHIIIVLFLSVLVSWFIVKEL